MKVKKIGKIWYLIAGLFSLTLSAVPSVELSIGDMNGRHLTEATVGVPFQAYVVVRDMDEHFSTPVLTGIEQFTRGSMSSGTQISIINGKQSSQRTFSYVLRADKPGTYTLGPARIHNQHITLESGMLTVKAGMNTQPVTSTEGQPALIKVEF